jgi:hypothetical protein
VVNYRSVDESFTRHQFNELSLVGARRLTSHDLNVHYKKFFIVSPNGPTIARGRAEFSHPGEKPKYNQK